MLEITIGWPVACELNGDRSRERWIGVCTVEGQEIALLMIHEEVALHCPRYTAIDPDRAARLAEAEQAAADASATIREWYRLPDRCP